MTQPSITCPTCGRTSYSPGDIEHKYCGACKRFHVDMFHRTIVHVASINPLKLHAITLRDDGHGNFGEPFLVVRHDGSIPEHATPGDMWLAHLNVNAWYDHQREDLEVRKVEPMPYMGDEEDPNRETLGPVLYTYQMRPERQVNLRWVPDNDLILLDFENDAQAISAAEQMIEAGGDNILVVKRPNEPQPLGWWLRGAPGQGPEWMSFDEAKAA